VEFVFNIEFSQNSPALNDIRIDIVKFVRLTMCVPGTAIISCSLVPADGDVAKETRHTLTLQTLWLNVFIVLSHLLNTWSGQKHRHCPTERIDGYGFVVTAVRVRRKKIQQLPIATCLARPCSAQDQLALPRSELALIDMWNQLGNSVCLHNLSGGDNPQVTCLV
jgi:hypothetical protein